MIAKLLGWLRSLFVVIWLIGIFLIGGWIGYYNIEPTSINLFGIPLPELTIGIYLSLTFTAGVSLGWFGTWLLARAKLYSRNRDLKKTQKEMEKLRIERSKAQSTELLAAK